MMPAPLRMLAVIALVACGCTRSKEPTTTTTPPPTAAPHEDDGSTGSNDCNVDADCTAFFEQPPDCCNRCEGVALNARRAEQHRRACAGKGGPPACPFTECPLPFPTAACVEHVCALTGGPTPPHP